MEIRIPKPTDSAPRDHAVCIETVHKNIITYTAIITVCLMLLGSHSACKRIDPVGDLKKGTLYPTHQVGASKVPDKYHQNWGINGGVASPTPTPVQP